MPLDTPSPNLQHILDTAGKYVGIREGVGPKNNPVVVGWIRRFGRNLKSIFARNNDSTAWCAIFVSKVLEECGYRPTYHALAAKYIKWGKPSKFTPGAVIVIKRKTEGQDFATGSRTGYHVGFFKKSTKNYWVVRGGNQKNMVRDSWYAKHAYELCAVRQPAEE